MSEANQNNSDEIDLLELIDIIWRGKWLIAIPSLLAALLTFLYLSLAATTYSISLRITPLAEHTVSDYAALNNIPNASTPIYAGGDIVGYEKIISSEKLMSAVLENFRLGTDLRQAIEELSPEIGNFTGSQEEKRLALSKAASEFSLESVVNELNDNKAVAYEISHKTKQVDLTRQILSRYTELATQNIRLQNLRSVAGLKKSAAAKLIYEKQSLEAEIKNDKQTYFEKLQARIAILREQAQIARALNLADPSQNFTIHTTASTNTKKGAETRSENLFRNGYKALEAEITLLESRDENTWYLFTPSYAQMAAKLHEIENDKSVQRFDPALNASPLSDERLFTPADFDFQNLLIEPKSNKPLIMILVTLLAGLLSTVIVLARHYIRNQSIREI